MMNPSLMVGAIAMMKQAATANQANTSKDGGSDSAVTLDSELDEGEIVPNRLNSHQNTKWGHSNVIHYVAH